MAGLKCGCVPNAYWCAKHDIYTGNTPPWGAGKGRHNEQEQVRLQETIPDGIDIEDMGCSCHINPPCCYCTRDIDE